jgi:hypothetical protein
MRNTFIIDGEEADTMFLSQLIKVVEMYILQRKGVVVNIVLRDDRDLQLLGKAYDIIRSQK